MGAKDPKKTAAKKTTEVAKQESDFWQAEKSELNDQMETLKTKIEAVKKQLQQDHKPASKPAPKTASKSSGNKAGTSSTTRQT